MNFVTHFRRQVVLFTRVSSTTGISCLLLKSKANSYSKQ